jgi:AbrB family looped-hinge helix DNA binding protein
MPRNKAEDKAKYALTKRTSGGKVLEAVLKYLHEESSAMHEVATAKMSSKHQITLPVSAVRRLGLEPGDRLSVRVQGDVIVLRPQPRDWVEYFRGSMKGVYGRTREEMDAYVRKERQSWRRLTDSTDS